MTAVEQEPSLLKGAWVLILECDYVWMKPMKVRACMHACMQ